MFHGFSTSYNDTKFVSSLLVNYTKLVHKKNNLNLFVIFGSYGLFETIKKLHTTPATLFFFFTGLESI